MHKTIPIFLCFLFVSIDAQAGDAVSGRYWQGGGTGAVECPKFVESMKIAKRHRLDSIGYANETQGYVMFVAGFQTAYNLQTPDTCDIFASASMNQILAWTGNYCRNNPLQTFGTALVALATELYPKRSSTCK